MTFAWSLPFMHKLDVQLRNQLIILSITYAVAMISETLNIPLIWVLSAKAASKELEPWQIRELRKLCLKYKSFPKLKDKMRAARRANELKAFYRDDVVMAALDTPPW